MFYLEEQFCLEQLKLKVFGIHPEIGYDCSNV